MCHHNHVRQIDGNYSFIKTLFRVTRSLWVCQISNINEPLNVSLNWNMPHRDVINSRNSERKLNKTPLVCFKI